MAKKIGIGELSELVDEVCDTLIKGQDPWFCGLKKELENWKGDVIYDFAELLVERLEYEVVNDLD